MLRRFAPALLILGLCPGVAGATAPNGAVDSIATGSNGVAGWAYDPDAKSTSINMQLKINGVLHVQGPANVYRPDVNAAFGITGNHGFLYTFPDISSWGSFKADVYAMDSSGVGSTLVGTRYSVKVKTGAASATVKVDSSNYTADSSGNYFVHNRTGGSTFTVTPSKAGVCFTPLSITRTVTSGATPSDMVFTANSCLSISGSVGIAGAGATVTVGGVSTTASSTGAYTLSGLPPATYRLTASKPSCSFSPTALDVPLTTASVTGKNFTTTCAYSILGSVGVAGAGATVSAGGKSDTASSTGTYFIQGLSAGTYTITASKTGCSFTSLSVTLGPDATNKNLATSCVYSISGNVGAAGAGAIIGASNKTTTVSSTGAYTISGLGNGTHLVSASKANCTFNPLSLSVTINGGNLTGKNFTSSCAYSVSGSVGAAGAGVTLTAGGQTVTSSADGAFSFAKLNAGTYTLTPSKAGCTFSPASFTRAISSNVTGLDFTATCGTVLPPLVETITEEPAELRWTDVVMNVTSVPMQAGGEGLVIEIDFANLHRVKVYESDPYWFKYYRGFFGDTPGSYRGQQTVTRESPPGNPGVGCWTGTMSPLMFDSSTRTGGIYDFRQCYGIQSMFGPTSDWWAINHNFGAIGPFLPISFGMYRIPGSSLGIRGTEITAYWRGLPRIPLDYGPNINELSRYTNEIQEVFGGEVTPDGWGLVPENPDLDNTRLFWVKDVAREWMLPQPVDTPTKPMPVNFNLIYSLYTNLSDKSTAFQRAGVAMGLGDDISSDDVKKEGFYVIGKNPNGSWSRSGKLDTDTALFYMKDSRSLVINGSGNNFQSAMGAMERMAQESGKSYSVAYYMPQSIGPNAYLQASNDTMRGNLTTVFKTTADQGWKLNVATHSWSGYVTTTTCASNCQNINHISFAPATMPSLWPKMSTAYGGFNGTATVVVGNKDILSDYTALMTQPSINNRITEMRVDTPHPVARILGSTDFKNLWKY